MTLHAQAMLIDHGYRVIVLDFDERRNHSHVEDVVEVRALADTAQFPEIFEGVHYVSQGVGGDLIETGALSLAEALEAVVTV